MKKRPPLGRILKKGSLLAVLLIFAIYGLTNLFLISPKGRSVIAGKISRITGLPASLEGASWSPWNGVSLYGIRIEQPVTLQPEFSKPLLQIESIRVAPAWYELRRRRLVMKSVRIEKPRFLVPMEIFSHLSTPESEKKEPPLVVSTETNATQAEKPVRPSKDPKIQPKETARQSPENRPPAIRSQPESDLLTTWIHVSDASFKLLSSFSEKPIYEITGAEGTIPVAGSASKSEITMRAVRCMETLIGENMRIPIQWQRPVLQLGPVNAAFSSIECGFGASLGITRDLPFQANFTLPQQKLETLQLGQKCTLQIGSLASQGRFQGLLRIPQTWRGQAVVQGSQFDVRYDSKEIQFDHGRGYFVFTVGAISCLDARLMGDSLSLLGNATILSDRRMAAAARIVSTPEYLATLSKSLREDSKPPSLTPLSTPQRAALDMQLLGRLGQRIYYKPDPRTKPVRLLTPLSPD